jgi:putative transposase
MPLELKRQLVGDAELTVERQCQLLGINRSTYYYQSCRSDAYELVLMKELDELYTLHPYYGSRRMKCALCERGFEVGRDLVVALMRKMGIEAIYAKRKLSAPQPGHKIYPYLLRGAVITENDQVWSTDITYVRMRNGFLYLAAVIDWASRYVLSWRLSNSLDGGFCRDALLEALEKGKPNIFNTDQGAQFTSIDFTTLLESRGIRVSMDGKGRALDNVFVERLWRSVKQEEIYIKDYSDGVEAYEGLNRYFKFYNESRPHMSLGYRTPKSCYMRIDKN